MKRWRCLVCGYIHTGDEPPERCPVCGAPKSAFEPAEGEHDANDKMPGPAAPTGKSAASRKPLPQPQDSAQAAVSSNRNIRHLAAQAKIITKLHGHPIAVHIPNGLLPVTTFFTLLAVLSGTETLAVAAKYNCFFAAAFMPLVLITGIIDWFNRFDGYLTPLFRKKIVCGLIVTILTLVLAIWWVTEPQIYLDEKPGRALFLIINGLDLAAASMAGFYGGKLLFND